MENIVDVIEKLGVPVAVCGASMYFIWRQTQFIQKFFMPSTIVVVSSEVDCLGVHDVSGKLLCKIHVTRGRLTAEGSARCGVVDDRHRSKADAKLIAIQAQTVCHKGAGVIAGDLTCCPRSAYFSVRLSAHFVLSVRVHHLDG